MFLRLLDDQEIGAFLGIARLLANADGTLHAKEESLLAAVSAEVGSPPEGVEIASLDDIKSSLEAVSPSGPARNVLLFELAGVALADGELSEAERAVLDAVADATGVDESRLAECLEIARRGVELEIDAEQLIASA